uniref:Thioredoxin domain-containing protein n=1 Tax=Lotharella oceanica TaxID=641309 RepID=A0A7S2TIC8_9EUKA
MNAEQKLAQMKAKVATQMMRAVKDTEKAIDDEIETLENLNKTDLENIRRKRIIEMKKKAEKMAQWRQKGHGTYTELADQKQWFEEVKANERTICLFYRNTTNASDKYTQILDKHLQQLAQKHMETRFLKINAEKSPFLAQKLNIVLLPTILCTKDNFTHDRIEGFDPLGGTESFTTETLRARLGKKKNIDFDPLVDKPLANAKRMYHTSTSNKTGKSIYASKLAQLGDDDDWDDISD